MTVWHLWDQENHNVDKNEKAQGRDDFGINFCLHFLIFPCTICSDIIVWFFYTVFTCGRGLIEVVDRHRRSGHRYT